MSIFNLSLLSADPAKKQEKEKKKYEHQKKIAQSLDKAAKLKLAKSPATQAEILYYLAQNDGEVAVRQAVASNDATPYQANKIIARDQNADVRIALAERLVKLLPDISQDTQSQLYSYTVDALEALAADEVAKVRIVLANIIKKELHAPTHIINKLARDIEREVAEPILHHCMAVSDEVLLEILSNHPAAWKVEAIAQRKFVSADISEAVIEAYHETAGVLLLDNKDADISKPTLFKIVEKSRAFTAWQKPLAVRAFLPQEIARKMAEFVDESVKDLIAKRTDLGKQVSEEIKSKFREDINQLEKEDTERLSPEDKVRKMIVDKTLNEDALIAAMDARDRTLAIVMLAALVRSSRSSMENIVGMLKPKPIVAVCHRAGVSMRTCLRIQQEIAKIPSKEIIYPRGGTDYPLEPDEIKWQLDFLGLK